jgi:branched-chain amino acid transport system ATP-binding protein
VGAAEAASLGGGGPAPPASRDGALLEVRDVQVAYGAGVLALQGVSLSVRPGEIVALIGANGAGKTTLLKTVAGLVAPGNGEIRFAGRVVDDLEAPERVKLGLALVPEGRRLFGRLTVAENLTLGTFTNVEAAHRREMLERVWTLFPVLRERARQRAGTLSGGEGQMLAIARALMSRPRFLMLDEPSLGIMPRLVDAILESLARLHRAEGLAMLLVEQNVPAALDLATRGYVLQTGRVVLDGTSRELLGSELVRKAYLGM